MSQISKKNFPAYLLKKICIEWTYEVQTRLGRGSTCMLENVGPTVKK